MERVFAGASVKTTLDMLADLLVSVAWLTALPDDTSMHSGDNCGQAGVM